jgi:hypothetical protein
MSCPHGNHPDACDICDEVAAAYNSGVEHTKRKWAGLTDEDVYPLANKHLRYQTEGYEVSGVYSLARAIEAKLKEKNT